MTTTDLSIRPFEVRVPKEDLTDLRRRLAATRWPGKELVADRSQGVQLATIQALVTFWGTGYDWRTCEARLNALPQFVTEIDGLDTEHKVGDPAFCRTGTRLRSVVSASDCVATRIPLCTGSSLAGYRRVASQNRVFGARACGVTRRPVTGSTADRGPGYLWGARSLRGL